MSQAGNDGGAPLTQDQFNGVLQQINGVFNNIAERFQIMSARAYATEAEWALHKQGRTPRMPIRFTSQFGEDALIWEVLDGQLGGLYIEVGAFDGKTFSVTYPLDACGWDGLLVEGIPQRVEQCRANRPHARVEHAALVGPGAPPTVEFTVIDDQYGGMLSFATADAHHTSSVKDFSRSKVAVPTATLDSLLERHFPGREVDVAVIDVEGGEAELLRGFDLSRWRPRLLLIEDNTRGQDTRLNAYFANTDYVLASWFEVNRVYVRKDQAEIRRRLTIKQR